LEAIIFAQHLKRLGTAPCDFGWYPPVVADPLCGVSAPFLCTLRPPPLDDRAFQPNYSALDERCDPKTSGHSRRVYAEWKQISESRFEADSSNRVDTSRPTPLDKRKEKSGGLNGGFHRPCMTATTTVLLRSAFSG